MRGWRARKGDGGIQDRTGAGGAWLRFAAMSGKKEGSQREPRAR